MNTTLTHRAIRHGSIIALLLLASQAFAGHALLARYSSFRPTRSITLQYAPKTDLLYLGTEMVAPIVSTPAFDVPALMTPLFSIMSGGHDGGSDSSHGGGGDDSSHGGGGGSNDSSGGHGGGSDSSSGGGGHDNDSTGSGNDTTGHHGDDSTGHDGGSNDSTGHHGDDSTGHHGGDDSTHSSNDTLDCGGHGERHHGHDGHDSLEVHDSTERAMFGNQHQSIVIKSDGSTAIVNLQFTNDLTQAIEVTSLALQTGANFKIAGTLPSAAHPISLPAGGKLPITIVFDAADVATHTDMLSIATNAQQATVSLEGIQVMAAAVSTTPSNDAIISISPNPSTGPVTVSVSGLANARITLSSSNGTLVASGMAQDGRWLWTPTSALANGEYFVRIEGTTVTGAAFVTTRNIIVAR